MSLIKKKLVSNKIILLISMNGISCKILFNLKIYCICYKIYFMKFWVDDVCEACIKISFLAIVVGYFYLQIFTRKFSPAKYQKVINNFFVSRILNRHFANCFGYTCHVDKIKFTTIEIINTCVICTHISRVNF
jgi:hypothetical protein